MNNNMKMAREKRGLSQKEVAITLKVSAPTVSDWESGKINPSAENLKKLSKLYQAPADFLLGLTNDSTYAIPNSNKILTNDPIGCLAAQYHTSVDVLSSISGAPISSVEKWLANDSFPADDEYKALSSFFEIPYDELKRGLIPLFPDEHIQLKILELTDIRFAAYEKDDDFTLEELQKIKDFASMVRRARSNQGGN